MNGNSQGLQWHFALTIVLGSGNVAALKSPRTTNPDAFGSKFHGGLNGPLHGAPKIDSSLKLGRYLGGDPLGIEFGLTNFVNIDFYLGPGTKFADVVGHHFDLGSTFTNDQSGARGMQGDPDAVPGSFDNDATDGTFLKSIVEISTDRQIFVQLIAILFWRGIPLRFPVFGDCQSKTYRMNFLSHICKLYLFSFV